MSYDVHIRRTGIQALIELQGEPGSIVEWAGADLPDLPAQANTASFRDAICLYWIGAGKWLLRAGLEREAELLAIAPPESAPAHISAVLVSDTLTFFRVSGPDAAQIAAIASPLDTHADVFPQNGVSYTEAFGLRALLLRIPGGFEIAVESSYADMLADYLARATAG